MILPKFAALLSLALVANARTIASLSSVSLESLYSISMGTAYTGGGRPTTMGPMPPATDTSTPTPTPSPSPTSPMPSPSSSSASMISSTATSPSPSSSGGVDPGRRLKNVTIAANDPRIILAPPEAWTPTPGNVCATSGATGNTLNTTLTTTTPQAFVAFNFTGVALFINIVSTRQTGVCNMVVDGVDRDGDGNTDGLNVSPEPACVPALALGYGSALPQAFDYGPHGLVMTIVGSSPKPETLGGSELQLDSITYTTYEDDSSPGANPSAPATAPSPSPSSGNGAKENLAVGFLGVWAVTLALFALL